MRVKNTSSGRLMKSSEGLDCISFTSCSIRFTAGFFRLYLTSAILNKKKKKKPLRISKNSTPRLQDHSKRRLDAESDPKQRLIPNKDDRPKIKEDFFFEWMGRRLRGSNICNLVGQLAIKKDRSATSCLTDDGRIDGQDFELLEGVTCRSIAGCWRKLRASDWLEGLQSCCDCHH